MHVLRAEQSKLAEGAVAAEETCTPVGAASCKEADMHAVGATEQPAQFVAVSTDVASTAAASTAAVGAAAVSTAATVGAAVDPAASASSEVDSHADVSNVASALGGSTGEEAAHNGAFPLGDVTIDDVQEIVAHNGGVPCDVAKEGATKDDVTIRDVPRG